jgi:hypothetical protein
MRKLSDEEGERQNEESSAVRVRGSLLQETGNDNLGPIETNTIKPRAPIMNRKVAKNLAAFAIPTVTSNAEYYAQILNVNRNLHRFRAKDYG